MLQRTCDCGQHTGGGQCEDCKKKKKMPLQRHANGSAAPAVAPPIVHDVLRSSGQPLEKDRSPISPQNSNTTSATCECTPMSRPPNRR